VNSQLLFHHKIRTSRIIEEVDGGSFIVQTKIPDENISEVCAFTNWDDLIEHLKDFVI